MTVRETKQDSPVDLPQSAGDTAEHKRRFASWLEMLRNGVASLEDVTGVLQDCLAKTGDAAFFLEAPDRVRSALLREFRRFRKTGDFEVIYAHVGGGRDLSAQALAAINALIRAGLLHPDAARIETPRPLFSGLEHIEEGQELMALASNDQGPVSAQLMSVGIVPVGAYEYPQMASLSIRIEKSRREFQSQGDGFYKDLPVRSAVAHLLLRRCLAGISFHPSFSLEYLVSLAIEPVRRGRRTGFELSLDFGLFEGEAFCESIALASIDPLSCAEPT